jgi:5-formyltetrahydrofolate cyclo-ligase
MNTKKELREIFQDKRNALILEELNTNSLLIFELLDKEFDFKNKTISVFLPIEHKKEINTFYFIEKKIHNCTITAPVSNFNDSTLKHIQLTNLTTQIKINQFGIPEPTFGEEIIVSNIDYVIIPLLAFDKNGYRVGYGKGFYDRFLKECKKDCVFIGLNYFDPIDKIEDINEFDIPLNLVVTPKKIYYFN